MKRKELSFEPKLARSFYLTLRVLPARMRRPVTLAYFMARAADTIADTDAVDTEARRHCLARLRAALREDASSLSDLTQMAATAACARSSRAERELLEKLPLMYRAHAALAPAERALATRLLETLLDGMVFDLIRFPTERFGPPGALRTAEELSRYTYLVAGVVGEYWTDMLCQHFPAVAQGCREEMQRLGVSFGQGLQMINILRDLPRDLARGRCYIPIDDLAGAGLAPSDLASGKPQPKFAPIFRDKLALAESQLGSGLKYLALIPGRMVRNRLSVALPLLIGAATLAELRRLENPLEQGAVTKISRSTLYKILLLSTLFSPSTRAIGWLYSRLKR